MFTVLLLAAIEKIVNLAIATDPITQAGLQPLSGKVLRLMMNEPLLEFDTIFNDDHIRFELVVSSVFEPKGSDPLTLPNCIITVANVSHLLYLINEPAGNLPIAGDYKVLMQVKQLAAGFDPDIIGKLQPIIGLPLASQLSMLLTSAKSSVAQPAKAVLADLAELAPYAPKSVQPADHERDELKQTLLKLRADIEREQARLQAIKDEQAQLTTTIQGQQVQQGR